MGTLFDKFTNKYAVSKTLRFRLKAVGETERHIQANGLLQEDEALAEKYKSAKKIIDEYHKAFIHEQLTGFSFGEEDLCEFSSSYSELKKNKNNDDLKTELANQQTKLRQKVADQLKNKRLFSKEFIQDDLPKWLEKNPIQIDDIEDPQKIIKDFNAWTTYFRGFNENRKNIYTHKAHSTAIGYRLIHENLPKFLDNIERYKKAKSLGVDFSDVATNFKVRLNDFFTLTGFNKCLTQEGIEKYNQIRGGESKERNEKQQGVNEKINLYAQKLENQIATASDEEKLRKEVRKCQLEDLYKQILSDRNTTSFRLEDIANDAELCKRITSAFNIDDQGNLIFDKDGAGALNVTEKLNKTMKAIKDADVGKLYIKNDRAITDISQHLFGAWDTIRHCLDYYAENNVCPSPLGKKVSASLLGKREKWLKQSYFSFADIHESLKTYFGERYTKDEVQRETNCEKTNDTVSLKQQWDIAMSESPLCDYFMTLAIKKRNEKNVLELRDLLETINRTYEKAMPVLQEYEMIQDESLKNEKEKVQFVKHYLDALMVLQGFLRPLHTRLERNKAKKVEVFEKDSTFYGNFDPLFETVQTIIPLYNQTRNYLTKKPYSVEKYKLNFENQTLADGWDKNKERDNACVLFMKDGQYFLGVMDKENRTLFGGDLPQSGNCYQKMEYKLLPGAIRTLPKVFFSQKNIKSYDPSGEILRIRNGASHTKSGAPQEGFKKKDFSISDMRKMIDFFKESIQSHPDWRQFGFQFSPTKSYEDISVFYGEVEHQGYKITWQDIAEDHIHGLVREGKLYLFQIYNKDFSPQTKGRPNLQTLYWKTLFDKKNLQNVVYKLNGNAELFYRKKSIEYSDEIWGQGHHANDPKKRQTYPIIKDRRYAENTYLFHVPITCNFKAGSKPSDFNDQVNAYLNKNPAVNIIGIDRGERHLAYYTSINKKGEILTDEKGNYLQDSLNNPLDKNDYHDLLDKREKERDRERKSWGTIAKIKDLKEGYVSQVVHKIAKLMVEHNAIVVFEDLNFGFKRGRFKIEKQIYQKFEKMLIDKLNYLVFKDRNPDDVGGTLRALQLTAPFESFKKLGKQTGFIFYVPAYHTSKVCPATGFVGLLYPNYETIEKASTFFKKFEKICFNSDEEYFEFHFNYEKFTDKAEGGKQDWVVCSYGKRLENFRNKNKQWESRSVDLTHELQELLKKYQVKFEDGECIIGQIEQQDSRDFFKSFIRLLKLTLQMRNSKIGTNEDWFISPVKDIGGVFFDSRNAGSCMPQNADANGAYHIGLKGLLMLEQLNNTADVHKFKPDLRNKAWYEFLKKRYNKENSK